MAGVGLLGGTFDPVHNGHLQLGTLVRDRLGLDRIIFIPAAHPPHKEESRVGSRVHRLEMLSCALADRDDMELSDIEMARDGLSYTIDTLEEMRDHDDGTIDYHFIIGSDAMEEIETWYRWQEFLTAVHFVVAVRPGFSVKQIEFILGRNGFTPESDKRDRWIHAHHGNRIEFLADKTVDISSTEIRERIGTGRKWKHMVPESVAAYISTHGLYGARI